MAARIYMFLKILPFHANGIGRQSYELSKQLTYILGSALRDTYHIPWKIHHFYSTDVFPRRESETAFTLRRSIPHNNVDLPLLASIEATGICMPTGKVKCYFQQSISHQAIPGTMQTSLSPSASDVRRYWQDIWMLNFHFGIAYFPTFQVWDYYIYCI
jgi:hypothetical protein